MEAVIIIIIIVGVIAFLLMGLPGLVKGRREDNAAVQSALSSDEQIVHRQKGGADYLGEHPPFGPPSPNGDMTVTNKGIIFSNALRKQFFKILYEDIIEISTETKESLTAARIILTGLMAPLWKKKKPFILIKMKNDIGEISKIGFGFTEPGLGSSFWPTSRWFQTISEQRYNCLKKQKTNSEQ